MKDKSEMMDRGRKNLSIKSMAFNRFLIFRYVTAGFFFTNMYWIILVSACGVVIGRYGDCCGTDG